MKQSLLCIFSFLLFFSLIGCSTTITTLQEVKAQSDKLTADKAYNTITSILVDKGFDVKVANKDIGLVTTEYKKYGSVDGNPPFDFYLQIKTQIKTRENNKVMLVLTPIVKQVNRLNSSAFTEGELVFLSDEEQNGYLDALTRTNLSGQLMFLNVVNGMSEALGLSSEQLEYNKKLTNKPMF